MSDAVLRAHAVGKSFDSGPAQVSVLKNVELEIARGERLAVLGRSGSGKSTLLHILGGLDDADSGEVWIGAQRVNDLSMAQRAKLRNSSLGFIISFTTCCLSLARWKTSQCHSCWPASGAAKALIARVPYLGQ